MAMLNNQMGKICKHIWSTRLHMKTCRKSKKLSVQQQWMIPRRRRSYTDHHWLSWRNKMQQWNLHCCCNIVVNRPAKICVCIYMYNVYIYILQYIYYTYIYIYIYIYWQFQWHTIIATAWLTSFQKNFSTFADSDRTSSFVCPGKNMKNTSWYEMERSPKFSGKTTCGSNAVWYALVI